MSFLTRIFVLTAAIFSSLPFAIVRAEESSQQFEDVEIRVIRPKYFQKSMRFEVAANVATVMNKSYTYTYLPSAKLGLHITEWLEIFGEGALGITANKSDCTELGTKFAIEPVVHEFNSLLGGGVALTPIYGKYQVNSGDVIYFDWFLMAGGGVASMKKREQGCKPLEPNEATKSPTEYNPGQFNIGTGQRYFLNKNVSVNWFLRDFFITELGAGLAQSVTLSFGASYYF